MLTQAASTGKSRALREEHDLHGIGLQAHQAQDPHQHVMGRGALLHRHTTAPQVLQPLDWPVAGHQHRLSAGIGVLVASDAHEQQFRRLGEHAGGAAAAAEVDLAAVERLQQRGGGELIAPFQHHAQRRQVLLQAPLLAQCLQMHQPLRHADAQPPQSAGLLLVGGHGAEQPRRPGPDRAARATSACASIHGACR